MAVTTLTDEQQQALIIAELGIDATTLDASGYAAFSAYLPLVWTRYDALRAFSADLGYLYPKRSAVQWLLARARGYMNWKRGKLSHNDRQRVQNLENLLRTVQEEIDVLVGRTQGGRWDSAGLLAVMGSGMASSAASVGTISAGSLNTAGSAVAGLLGVGPGSGTITQTVTRRPAAPVVAEPELGTTYYIQEGGFSQVVIEASEGRTLFSIHNTSSDNLWFRWDDDAGMGGTGNVKVAPGITIGYRAPDAEVPTGYLSVIGPTTGQSFIIRDEADEVTTATDPTAVYTDISGVIESGGESQQLAEIDQDRVYLSITNTSSENLWFNVAEWASMDDNSILIEPGETKTYTGDSAGPEDLYIVGPTTGQTFTATSGSRASA